LDKRIGVTATLYLIRHAAHDHIGRVLSGRMEGLALSDDGRAQAGRLAAMLRDRRFAAIYTSPVQRARETAAAIAAGRDIPVTPASALDEIDFGAWTGQPFAALDGDAAWRRWNDARGAATVPGGETMVQAQARAVAFAQDLAATHDGAAVALVSHCDVIRALLAHALDLSLDRLLRFEVDPASISRVAIEADGAARVLSINEAGA